MTDDDLLALAAPLIEADEGDELVAYVDTVGVYTDGVGHAHVAPGTRITEAQSQAQFRTDLSDKLAELVRALPWSCALDGPRRYVLLNMAFELGVEGLCGFVHTLQAIEDGNYALASGMMLMSKWDGQVPARASRLARIMKTGLLPLAKAA